MCRTGPGINRRPPPIAKVLLAALSLLASATAAAEEPWDELPSVLPATSSEAVDRLLAEIERDYASMDVERFVSHFTGDFRMIDVNRRVSIQGIEAWRAQTCDVNGAHRAMARRHLGRIAQGDTVIAEIEWSGTVHGGGADRRYRYRGLGILTLRDGKISGQIMYSDHVTLLSQLGR